MPTIKGAVTAASTDALATENLRKIPAPGASITLLACAQTATDRLQLYIGQTALTNSVQPNLVTDADAGPNTSTDVLVDDEIVPAGDLSMPVTACTAQVQYQLIIKYLG